MLSGGVNLQAKAVLDFLGTVKLVSIMSFWNFLGGFALFDAFCDMFSSKPSRPARLPGLDAGGRDYACVDCEPDFGMYDFDECDVDSLQERIDELEDCLADCDVMSDRYDELQERIDSLRDRLDEMEEHMDMYDELSDEYDDLCDELDDMD